MPFLVLNNSIECDMCANLKLPKTAAPGQAKAHIGAGGSACKLAPKEWTVGGGEEGAIVSSPI